jgi:hypothetical protein
LSDAQGYWESALVMKSLDLSVTFGKIEVEEKSLCGIQRVLCKCGLAAGRKYIATPEHLDELEGKCLLDISAISKLPDVASRDHLVSIPMLVEDCIQKLQEWNKCRIPHLPPSISISQVKPCPKPPSAPSAVHHEIIEID